MEYRQNWHKFQRMLGRLPAKKKGMALLCSNQRIIAGVVGDTKEDPTRDCYDDTDLSFESPENVVETLSHKHAAVGSTFIDRNQLLEALGQVTAMKGPGGGAENFYSQVGRLRELMGIQRGDKTPLAIHFGDRPVDSFWPREHFLISIFQSFFADLLPERKLFLVCILRADGNLDASLLEYQAGELKSFWDPDFSGFEWRELDLFLPENLGRFVLWCENQYLLPTYSLITTEHVWEECRSIQMKHGNKAAWKHLAKIKSQRDAEKEVLFDPEPWPVKALLKWHAMRG